MAADVKYRELRDELLRSGRLFEDPVFPASERSLRREGLVRSGVRWRRPWEMVTKPRFIVEEATRFDLDQGELGNCWFISAAACLAVSNRKLFERCVPQDQRFDKEYAGIFRFHFWHFDSWVEVLVDDRLPTLQGRLIYARNREQPQEFWAALLEKAYAKLYGCYENLAGGHINDALVDFTGGISERFYLARHAEVPNNLYELMWRTARMNSMMGCSIRSKTNREEPIGNGLYRGHAYSITSLAKLRVNSREVRLLRLRNPWGRDEWMGAWSDRSREWRAISDEDKAKIGLIPREDGEFWMSYEDFIANFEDLDFCHLYPDAFTSEIAIDMRKQSWNVAKHHGEWLRGFNAGGCGNPPDQDLLWTNPQYRITMALADEDATDGKCTVVVSLMQKTEDQSLDLSINYLVYKVKPGVQPLPDGSNYDFDDVISVTPPITYSNYRERTGRHALRPGSYVIIPTTFLPNREGKFLLRLYTEKKAATNVVDIPTNPGNPAAGDDQVEYLFTKYAGEDGKVYAEELMIALNELEISGYGRKRNIAMETARSLIAMHDEDDVGYIRLKDFRSLFRDVDVWQRSFKAFDRDNSGTIDTYELSKLFATIGFSVSRQVQSAIVRRYGGRRRRLIFEDFIHIMCKLHAMYYQFHKRKGSRNTIQLDLEEWLAVTLFY